MPKSSRNRSRPCDPLRTLAVYAKDAPREFDEMPRPEGRKDYQHMNGEYGAPVLRALFAMPGFQSVTHPY